MSLHGRLLRAALPLVKLRTRLRGVTLGVAGAAFDETGRVLLVRHSYADGWRFPGGGVEFGEAAADALSRELQEEVRLTLTAPPVLKGLYRNPEWTAGDHVAFFHVRQAQAGAFTPNLEIEAAQWFSPGALPEDAHPAVRRRLAEADGAAACRTW